MKHNLVLNLTNPTLALAIVEKINLNIEINL